MLGYKEGRTSIRKKGKRKRTDSDFGDWILENIDTERDKFRKERKRHIDRRGLIVRYI